MNELVFDIETDGLLDTVSKVHSLVITDYATRERTSYADQPGYLSIEEGVRRLQEADLLVGHNIMEYDLQVFLKLYPWFTFDRLKVRDTIILARLVWPKDILKDLDFKLQKKGKLAGNLIGAYKLEAFGYRLGLQKGEYSAEMKAQGIDPWTEWRPEMQEYCELDVDVTTRLYERIQERIAEFGWSEQSVELEHRVAWIMLDQQRNGVLFDQEKAATLYAELVAKREELAHEMRAVFKPWYVGRKVVEPTRSMRYKDPLKGDVTAGAPYQKIELITFNPASRDHIASRFMKLYGWEPEEYTDNGKPKVDEVVVSKLPFPEAPLVAQYLLIQKRIGQLAEGDEAWLKHVKGDGRIHGRVNPNAAITRRAAHSGPNKAQVPKVGSPYGRESRTLFRVPKRKKMVGVDLAGIEMRMQGHYMWPWDAGKFASAVVEGSSEDGTDAHTLNCIALGLEPKKVYTLSGKTNKGRDFAKTWYYAFLYGAGDEKLGKILGEDAASGRSRKVSFLKKQEALGKLIKAVQAKARERGYVVALDGGLVFVRSRHAALNTLLQSAGAIVAKQWLVEMEDEFNARGWLHSRRVMWLLWVHDEVQLEVDEEIADEVGRVAIECIVRAGRKLNVRVPLSGEYKVGDNWAETH